MNLLTDVMIAVVASAVFVGGLLYGLDREAERVVGDEYFYTVEGEM